MENVKVMHLTDSLHAAGRQRVAVNLANLLLNHGYQSYLCTTRADGPLELLVHKNVQRLRLAKTHQLDLRALYSLVDFIREHQIQVLHAHGVSLFMACMASTFPPFPAVVWHDHYGRFGQEKRSVWLYRLGATRIRGVITVSEPLAEWSRSRLHVPTERVWYIPNFSCVSASEGIRYSPALPGDPESRIVCVANLRPQKDHLTLLRGMRLVIQSKPRAHLLLVGDSKDPDQYDRIMKEIVQHRLEKHVSLLGERQDVQAILQACSVGVLSSASEGFPLTLLEYGMAGLPVVATKVGQCGEILNGGHAGLLVPPGSPDLLAEALLQCLLSSKRRSELGQRLRIRVQEHYSPNHVVSRICQIYETVLGSKNGKCH